MPSLISQSFGLNLFAMRIFGLCPPDQFKGLYKIQSYLMYLLFIVPVPILQCLNLYMQEELSFMQIADNTFLIAELGCFIPKFWPFVMHGERVKKCIFYFDGPQFAKFKTEHPEITEDCIKVCRVTTRLFLTAVTTGFVSWSSRPISWKNHTFPTDIWLPFDLETAPRLYICCVYVYLVLAVGYGAYTSAAVDPLVAGLAYQATSQIKTLKKNLQFLDEYVEEEIRTSSKSDSKRDQIMYAKIRQCAIHYDYILEFVKEYEECFSQVAFSQFAGGVIVFCVSCLQLTIIDILTFDFLAMIMYLVAMLSEVYIYCHFGTILYEESNTIAEAVYLSKWYEFDMKSKKSLILLMERAQKPVTIVCGKILDMSLVTFTMILRRSYSLLAVLENYNIELS